jgi:REP element-mobilizing transposase RayT
VPNYRRALIPGGCFFFPVNMLERRQALLVDRIACLREAVATTRRSHPFAIDVFLVLPDHLHTVWILPPGDSDFSTRWRLIVSRFAKALPKQQRLSAVRRRATNAASGSGGSGNEFTPIELRRFATRGAAWATIILAVSVSVVSN